MCSMHTEYVPSYFGHHVKITRNLYLESMMGLLHWNDVMFFGDLFLKIIFLCSINVYRFLYSTCCFAIFFCFISREQKVSESYLLFKWYRLLQNFNDWTLSFFDLRTWILNTEHCTCFVMCYVVYWLWSHLLNHGSKDPVSNGWF